MKTKWTLLPIAGLLALAPAMTGAQTSSRTPMVVTNVSGNLHIFQSTPFPCPSLAGDVPVIGGRFDLSPAEGFDAGGGNKRFTLTRGTVHVSPFVIDFSCLTHSEHDDYTALSVQVANAPSFVAAPSSPGVYSFAIPAEDVLLREGAIKNGAPEVRDTQPAFPVTGTIDLNAGTVSMHVVVAIKIHVDVLGDFDGTLTTDLSGTISFPDADGDGVPDRTDNCPLVSNGDQGTVASPLITAPDDVTLHSCQATTIGRPVAADICESRPVTVSNDAPHPYALGSTVVTWSAMDSHSHVRTDTQTVTIDDTTPPVFTSVPAGIVLTDCGPAVLGLPTATDDCGGSPTFTNDAPAIFLAGVTTVTWTATDLSGNHATATQTVTVTDTVAPTVACVPAGPPGGTFRVSASDHCAAPVIRLGGFVLANNERIKINETGHSGVTFVGYVVPDNIRHFQVGKGEAVVTATDPSGNSSTALCPN